jgi:hypothetical protein
MVISREWRPGIDWDQLVRHWHFRAEHCTQHYSRTAFFSMYSLSVNMHAQVLGIRYGVICILTVALAKDGELLPCLSCLLHLNSFLSWTWRFATSSFTFFRSFLVSSPFNLSPFVLRTFSALSDLLSLHQPRVIESQVLSSLAHVL